MLFSIPSPSNGTVDLGPLPLHAYGLLLAIGVLAATKICDTRWQRRGGDPKVFADCVIWIVIAGVVGARVYHLFTGYDWDDGGLAGTVKIWEGGLSIWGVLLDGIFAIVVLARVKHFDPLVLMDCAAPGLLVAQAIGRWGNYFNQELFGKPTDLPWGLEIDQINRPAEYPLDETFHPTFLYESLYCVLILGVLLWAERRFRFRVGQTTFLYLAMYTFGRFFFENLRVDPAEKLWGLRFNAWVSALACVVSAAVFVYLGRKGRPYTQGPGAPADSEHAPTATAEPG